MREEIESTAPQWIIARLGEDYNWWLESTSDDSAGPERLSGVLDPRQVTHLTPLLEKYRAHGLPSKLVMAAFKLYSLDSEIDEGRVRLALDEADELSEGGDLFAFPVIESEADGPYYEFLDALAAARVRLLNATHSYVQDCTEEEMFDELNALDTDRYFNADAMHCFDEIMQILDWSPAEWDR